MTGRKSLLNYVTSMKETSKKHGKCLGQFVVRFRMFIMESWDLDKESLQFDNAFWKEDVGEISN